MSPSPYGPRGEDASGSGAFSAPRRGGRRHRGLDVLVRAGELVRAPITGRFSRYGFCYADEPSYRYVSIAGRDGVLVRIFYVEALPSLERGERVVAGELIGTAQAISARYGGRLPDHLHVEVWVDGKPVDPAPLMVWT